jgi:hypothetical protein
MNIEREVVIVLSNEFAAKLNDLAMSSHVWVVRTAATEEVAHRIWEEWPPQETDPLIAGLTLFKGEGDHEGDLLSILDEVELHHGLSGGHVPPMDAVRVLALGRRMLSEMRLARLASPVLSRLLTGSSSTGARRKGDCIAGLGDDLNFVLRITNPNSAPWILETLRRVRISERPSRNPSYLNGYCAI